VIRAGGGRAFLLFTTLRAMRLAHELLREEFRRHALGFPLMLQGEGSRSSCSSASVGWVRGPAASTSFWEGVDVRGDALSLVVIDKLPFAPPTTRLLAARLEALEREGGNPFLDYQLPHAVISLKQGAGG